VPSVEILKDERLLEWRLERFAELGFSAAESSELAESEAHWHLAAAAHEPMRTPGPGRIALRGSSACAWGGSTRSWEHWK